MIRSLSRVLSFALVLGAGMLASSEAFAQARPVPGAPRPSLVAPSAPLPERVGVEVLCVRATNANTRVDDRLEPMLKQLRYTRFTGFSLMDQHTLRLAPGQEGSFEIEGNRKVAIDLLERNASEARLRIRMFNGQGRQQLDTTVTIHRDRSFMVAGPHLGEDVLILPVTVKY